MEIRINQKMIKEMCGAVSYKKGDTFYRSNKVAIHQYTSDYCEASVLGVETFYVTITKGFQDDLQTTCSCPTLPNFQMGCQHVAAVLLAMKDMQGKGMTTEFSTNDNELTNSFISLFNNPKPKKSRYQRYFEERENFDLKFTCKPVTIGNGNCLFGVEIEIGGKKLLHIREFLTDVKLGKPSSVSLAFTYDPNTHCFLPETDAVLHQLIRVIQDEKAFLEGISPNEEYIVTDQVLLIPPSSWGGLAPLLAQAPSVTVEQDNHHYEKLVITHGIPPLTFTFQESQGEDYLLIIEGFDRLNVMNLYQSVLSNGRLFQLQEQDCDRLFELKQMVASPGKNEIPIPEGKINFFLEKIVPDLKKLGRVDISKELSQKFMKTPLTINLYLDRLNNRLLAGLEFHYENVVIQPLENRDIPTGPMIVRDVDKEDEILTIMEESGFSKTNGGYFMQNEKLEYEFLYHVVPTLKKKLRIYATTAVRTRIFRENTFPRIRVKVKKERTNWLEFKFEMDGIADKEIKELLVAMEEKRKYYRLRNGSLFSLETKEVEEIQRFLYGGQGPIQDDNLEATLNMSITEGLKFLDLMEDSEVFTAEESFQQFLEKLRHPENLDFEVPPQLENVLRGYQKEGYRWMKMLASYGFGGVLADDMGLGKTIQSLAFILSELSTMRESNQPVLIVCPSSLTYNWLQEIMRFAPELQTIVIDGNKQQREGLFKNREDVDIIITSYPLLRQDIKLYEKEVFHTVFFDEAQAFKNPVTLTARAVKRIQADRRFGLTGTPVENSLEEFWSIYHVVFPQLFQGLREFSFLTKKSIGRRVRPFLLRRIKEDVLFEFPEKTESLDFVELLPEQKKLYASYLAKLRHDTWKHLDKDTFRKNRIRILAGLTRLRQICCHPGLFVDGYKGSSAKLEQLLQIVEESRNAGRRVLIFSQFTSMLQIIGRELYSRGVMYFYLDGQTPSLERIETCNRFNEGERDLFLISLKAGGTGLNLTGADTVILYDLWWNPAVEEQAADRAHRIGQKKDVNVIKLVARGTIEEKMNELQDKKRDLITEVVDSEDRGTTLTEEDIREILMI